MTGYLHIPDDAKLAAAVQDAIRDYPCMLGHVGDQCPTAVAILGVLRGLSVEPTESSALAQSVSPEFAEGIRMAAQVVHAEARWQTERRMRMTTQNSRVRADEKFGYLLERLASLEAVLLNLAAATAPAHQAAS